MLKITPPLPAEYPSYYGPYISKVNSNDLIKIYPAVRKSTHKIFKNITNKKLNYRYAEGKWTIKEIIGHLLDAERIFAYRALRFARNDRTSIPGFEENDYAKVSNAQQRSFKDLMNEYDAVRETTVLLFKSFDEEMIMRKGIANNLEISVRALGYIIAGHELHHAGVIKEKYLMIA